ncbi:cyanovirin-n domain-containing protein [Colletotrichum chrysophilum]|uniref:Cyanovirin-n domain-containing protein n=1 Tax=Colletotrichum chrysophilum TaxID=1836956 RepID=A0AAD9AJ72_9PEZI|nr:cyanovirin-n domain-containing protein [Colletotrichum chrysophilum]
MRMNTLLSLLTAVPIAQVAAKDFSGSCSGMSYFSTSIKAFCFTADNEYSNDSSLDLRSCLANVGGQVVFCDCGLAGDKKTLNCRCTDASGTKKPSSLNLGKTMKAKYDGTIH